MAPHYNILATISSGCGVRSCPGNTPWPAKRWCRPLGKSLLSKMRSGQGRRALAVSTIHSVFTSGQTWVQTQNLTKKKHISQNIVPYKLHVGGRFIVENSCPRINETAVGSLCSVLQTGHE